MVGRDGRNFRQEMDMEGGRKRNGQMDGGMVGEGWVMEMVGGWDVCERWDGGGR